MFKKFFIICFVYFIISICFSLYFFGYFYFILFLIPLLVINFVWQTQFVWVCFDTANDNVSAKTIVDVSAWPFQLVVCCRLPFRNLKLAVYSLEMIIVIKTKSFFWLIYVFREYQLGFENFFNNPRNLILYKWNLMKNAQSVIGPTCLCEFKQNKKKIKSSRLRWNRAHTLILN